MERQLLIRRKQLEVQMSSIKGKKMQFEIRLLELEEEADKIKRNMDLQDEAIIKLEADLKELI